jgi:hypothetical protein
MTTLRVKTDLRCGACVAKVRPALDAAPDVTRWEADVSTPDKVLTLEGDNLTAERAGALLGAAGYRVLGEVQPAAPPTVSAEKPTSYYPLLLVLLYLLAGTAALELAAGQFSGMRAMNHFMAGFFLVFSFFKLLDVRAFADAYRTYDIVAAKWPVWGFVYPFVELGLGLAYLAHAVPVVTNAVTILVTGVSTVGVVKAVLAKRRIRCACLGTVWNLPMSKVTLIEDGLMLAMAGAMLVMLLM